MGLIVDPFREMANALRSRPGIQRHKPQMSKRTLVGWRRRHQHEQRRADRACRSGHVRLVLVDRQEADRLSRRLCARSLQAAPPQPAWPYRSGEVAEEGQRSVADDFLSAAGRPNDGELYVFSTSSKGGRDALANLQEAYADNREFHPQDAHKLPLVTLSTDHYTHPEYGRVETPLFEIVRWVDPPANMKAIKPPASAYRCWRSSTHPQNCLGR